MTSDITRLDRSAKKLMSQKVLLAWLLKNCTEEFKSLAISDIMNYCIEGTPGIINEMVHAHDSNSGSDSAPVGGNGLISGLNTEDNTINEGTRYHE